MYTRMYSFTVFVFLLFIIQPWSRSSAQVIPLNELNEKWSFHGIGKRQMNFGMFYMKEGTGSKGVMIVSPETYGNEVLVRYEMMPLTAASVCVVILNASDSENEQRLTIPSGYDGSIGFWINNSSNHFFAFHNEAHNATPFLNRSPGSINLARHETNVMEAGNFYTIETGRSGKKLWLEIDGKKIFETEDANPIVGGHVAFRIRGLTGEPASCLIRKVEIDM